MCDKALICMHVYTYVCLLTGLGIVLLLYDYMDADWSLGVSATCGLIRV
jgi:hypothetical protein